MEVIEIGFNISFFDGAIDEDFCHVIDVKIVAGDIDADGHFEIEGEAIDSFGAFCHGVLFAIDNDDGGNGIFIDAWGHGDDIDVDGVGLGGVLGEGFWGGVIEYDFVG